MTPRKGVEEMKQAIRDGWNALVLATEPNFVHDQLRTEALSVAMRQERQHRRMGQGLQARPYRLSVAYAARAIVLHHFYQWTEPPENWQEFLSTRRDCACAYALHEAVGEPELLDRCKLAWSIDYAADIAGVDL